jgi:hypothetical protein
VSFLAALWATPAEGLSPLSKYIVANGVLYMLLGAGLYLGAGPALELAATLGAPALTDVGLARVAGMAVLFIGWFYVMGGRTGAVSFGLGTVVDRLLLPAFLLPLWWLGELPALFAVSFCVLDPLLALGALWLWRRSLAR